MYKTIKYIYFTNKNLAKISPQKSTVYIYSHPNKFIMFINKILEWLSNNIICRQKLSKCPKFHYLFLVLEISWGPLICNVYMNFLFYNFCNLIWRWQYRLQTYVILWLLSFTTLLFYSCIEYKLMKQNLKDGKKMIDISSRYLYQKVRVSVANIIWCEKRLKVGIYIRIASQNWLTQNVNNITLFKTVYFFYNGASKLFNCCMLKRTRVKGKLKHPVTVTYGRIWHHIVDIQ